MAKEINDPGTRKKNGGVVIQMTKRSQQLENIANNVQGLLEQFGSDNGVIMPAEKAYKISGWMEQVGIIAEELRKAGK